MLELAELHREDGRPAAAATSGASAEQLLRAGRGFGLDAEQQQRVDQVLDELRGHRAIRQGAELTKDRLLELLVD